MSIEVPTDDLKRTDTEIDCVEKIRQCESNSAKLVVLYLSITENGASTDKISDEFDMKKINIIPVLQNLCDEQIIERTNNIYTLC